MPGKLRVQYPGAIYPVMNRGNRREPIFNDDQDRRRFIETFLTKMSRRIGDVILIDHRSYRTLEQPWRRRIRWAFFWCPSLWIAMVASALKRKCL